MRTVPLRNGFRITTEEYVFRYSLQACDGQLQVESRRLLLSTRFGNGTQSNKTKMASKNLPTQVRTTHPRRMLKMQMAARTRCKALVAVLSVAGACLTGFYFRKMLIVWDILFCLQILFAIDDGTVCKRVLILRFVWWDSASISFPDKRSSKPVWALGTWQKQHLYQRTKQMAHDFILAGSCWYFRKPYSWSPTSWHCWSIHPRKASDSLAAENAIPEGRHEGQPSFFYLLILLL